MAFDMAEYKARLDEISAGVMPETAPCHGRLTIHEHGFNPEHRSVAERVFGKLTDKYPDQPSEMLAEKAIESVEKNQ